MKKAHIHIPMRLPPADKTEEYPLLKTEGKVTLYPDYISHPSFSYYYEEQLVLDFGPE